MGFAPLAVTAATGVMGAMNQRAQGKAAEETAKYSAKLQLRNAEAERHARVENLQRQKDDKSRSLAKVRLRQAASGIAPGQGSSAMVYDEIEDRLDERIESMTNASFQREAGLFEQARMTEFTGEQQKKAANTAAFGTLLSTAASVGGQYRGMVRSGRASDTFGLYKTKY